MVCACALASKMDFRPRVRFRSGLCNYLRNAYSTDGSPGAAAAYSSVRLAVVVAAIKANAHTSKPGELSFGRKWSPPCDLGITAMCM